MPIIFHSPLPSDFPCGNDANHAVAPFYHAPNAPALPHEKSYFSATSCKPHKRGVSMSAKGIDDKGHSAACGRNQNESATDFADYHRFLKKDYTAEGSESTTAGLFPPS
jgi:hypothetical protein